MAVRASDSQGALTEAKPLIGGVTFDVLALVSALWMVAGAYSDAWAHIHIARLETFFTPWHGFLYSGVLASFAVLVGTTILNRLRGASSWPVAVPLGYAAALLGVVAFIFVGVGDAIWHTLFGIERDIEAQFSPTHVAGMVCTCLVSFGPYCALSRRFNQPTTLVEKGLLVFAQFLVLASITIVSLSAYPLVSFWPAEVPRSESAIQQMAVVSMLLEGIFLTGLLLYTVRTWRLFTGFFTCTYLLFMIPIIFVSDHIEVLIIGGVAGVLTDVLYAVLRPSIKRPEQFRLFFALVPAVFYLVYFIVIGLLHGLVWSIHLSAGAITISAIFGWLLTYLVLPAEKAQIYTGE